MGRKGFCKCSIKFKAVWIKSELRPRICLEIFKPRVGWKKKKKKTERHRPPTNVCTVWKSRHHACCVSTSKSIQMKAPWWFHTQVNTLIFHYCPTIILHSSGRHTACSLGISHQSSFKVDGDPLPLRYCVHTRPKLGK